MAQPKVIIENWEIPFYGGRFVVLFSYGKTPISDHCDDLGTDVVIDYGHFQKVNIDKVRGFFIGFNLTNKYDKITHGVISHEVFHASCAIMDFIGAKLKDASEETYAYLIRWLTDKVYEVVRNNKIEIN